MKNEENMKTGRDANQPGTYTSECCLVEINVTKGQMLRVLSASLRDRPA
jgi:hypothetical protein